MPVCKKEVSQCPVDAMMRVMDGRLERHDSLAPAGGTETHQRTQAFHSRDPERMLIRHLQELVADGIVKRDDKKTIPPCVYYALTSYGRTLGPVVQMMCNWGRSHLRRLSAGPSVR
jgi:DNA-binding HxlR family transcriptional regulator